MAGLGQTGGMPGQNFLPPSQSGGSGLPPTNGGAGAPQNWLSMLFGGSGMPPSGPSLQGPPAASFQGPGLLPAMGGQNFMPPAQNQLPPSNGGLLGPLAGLPPRY